MGISKEAEELESLFHSAVEKISVQNPESSGEREA